MSKKTNKNQNRIAAVTPVSETTTTSPAKPKKTKLEKAKTQLAKSARVIKEIVGWTALDAIIDAEPEIDIDRKQMVGDLTCLIALVAKLPASFVPPKAAGSGGAKKALFAEGAKVTLSEKGKKSFGWALAVGDVDREFRVIKSVGKRILVEAQSGARVTGTAAHVVAVADENEETEVVAAE